MTAKEKLCALTTPQRKKVVVELCDHSKMPEVDFSVLTFEEKKRLLELLDHGKNKSGNFDLDSLPIIEKDELLALIEKIER